MHIKTFCTGGLFLENSSVFIGKDANNFIENYNVNICFLSCKGLSFDGKLTDTSIEETELRKKIMTNSKQKIFLMTDNKLGKTYIHTVCKSTDVDYIFSNIELPDEIKTKQTLNNSLEFRNIYVNCQFI